MLTKKAEHSRFRKPIRSLFKLGFNCSNRGLKLFWTAIVLVLALQACSPPSPQAVTPASGGKPPEHIALTWQGNPATTQSFTWRTAVGDAGTVVEWMETAEYTGFPSEKGKQKTGVETTFKSNAGEMLIHEAEVTGLRPGVSYTYRVGSGMEGEWSEPYQFTTAPEPDQPFTFLFVSDTQAAANTSAASGYGVWGEMLRKALAQVPDARFILLSGDIVDQGDKQEHWNKWFEGAQDSLPNINIVPTLGNHDVLGSGRNNFRAQFQLPDNGPLGEKELVYSFDIGSAHIAVLDSEGNLASQAAWLKDDMAASNKPWKIVSFHRSPYQSHPARASLDVRGAWTPAFDAAGVDLVLSGHDHAYMRTWPIYNGDIVPEQEGTTYIIGGTAGPKFYDMGEYPWMRVKFDENIQIFSVVSIDGDELTLKVTTRDNRSVDAFTLHKATADQRYADVPQSHWAFASIEKLSKAGILNGVQPNRFLPSKTTTRAELTAMLARTLQLPAAKTASFADVRSGDWYYDSVAAATQAGLVEGGDSGRFEPNRPITRQELAVLLVRAYTWKSATPITGDTQAAMFTDHAQIAPWAATSIESAVKLGLLAGRDNGVFAPNTSATRAESAQALENLLQQSAASTKR